MTARLRAFLFLIFAALSFAALPTTVPVAQAQETASTPNYVEWEKDAAGAEEALATARASSKAFEDMRARIVEWRTRFDTARAINAPQIETTQAQINALGPAPADGASEAPEIAQRRRELGETLARLQAPALTADEAFRRADGIVRQTDALVRERQAKELLRLMPSPANPLHWPSGYAVLSQGLQTLSSEVSTAWQNPGRRTELGNNLPAIIVCLLVAAFLMLRGPGFMERLSRRLQRRASMRGRNAVSALVSLGQVIVPTMGMTLVLIAIVMTKITGARLEALAGALPFAAFSFFSARWLASWLFPGEDTQVSVPRLTDRASEARFHVSMLGLLVAAEVFRRAFTTEVRPPLSQAAQAVWLAPLVCIAAVFLFRLGILLRRQRLADMEAGEDLQFRNRMVGLAGTLMLAVSVLAPLCAVIGYVAAANAMIWPLIDSMGLIGLIILLQRFLTDIYVIITRSGDEGREALIPVLTGFFLVIAAIPLFALIWGARPADLAEVWTRFQAGVSLGSARISPGAILTLIVVFTLGYMLTRLVQGALRSQVLPRTKLDKGAQTAAISGFGYLGLLLSGLVAVTTAGIDLSALAIVAGALSVGIGFGLQNIVQNFIAGIILLVERPISEGDSIEVRDKAGTVKQISVRSTRIVTSDQAEVIVPNAEFISGIVTNWTRENLKTRLVVPVTVAYGSDSRRVEALLRDIIDDQPLVLIDPPPDIYLMGFGQSGLNFEGRAVLSDLNFKNEVLSEINHTILARFAEEGIEIPLGFQEVQLRAEEAVPKARIKRPARKPVAVAISPQRVNNDPANDPDERTEDQK